MRTPLTAKFAERVQLHGVAHVATDMELRAPLSQRPCLAYGAAVRVSGLRKRESVCTKFSMRIGGVQLDVDPTYVLLVFADNQCTRLVAPAADLQVLRDRLGFSTKPSRLGPKNGVNERTLGAGPEHGANERTLGAGPEHGANERTLGAGPRHGVNERTLGAGPEHGANERTLGAGPRHGVNERTLGAGPRNGANERTLGAGPVQYEYFEGVFAVAATVRLIGFIRTPDHASATDNPYRQSVRNHVMYGTAKIPLLMAAGR